MSRIQIGETLRTMRKSHGWTVEDVARLLKERYNVEVAAKTIYGWESDQTYPRTETLLMICELYDTDSMIGGLFHTPSDRSFPITIDERRMIQMYRMHPELQNAIKRMLDAPPVKPSKINKNGH